MKKYWLCSLSILLIIALTACSGTPENATAPSSIDASPTQVPNEPLPPTETSIPPTETPIPPTPAPPQPLPPDPQVIEFTAEDGAALKGTYFPAAVNPAPIVVMMPEADFNERQWKAIAPWLQNRGVTWTTYAQGGVLASLRQRPLSAAEPWFDPSWFPPIPETLQVAVFTMNFRGCEAPDGCMGLKTFQGDNWVKDAAAAIETASELEGVDPNRVVAIGTSIGADGTVDGCQLYQKNTGRKCSGAMPVSPGSFLKVDYKETVTQVISDGIPVMCYAGKQDTYCYDACTSYEEVTELYQTIIVDGRYHGIFAADPVVKPPLVESILTFLDWTLGSQ